MKTCKAFISIVTFLLVVFEMPASTQAALSGLADGLNDRISMDSVGTYLYDPDSSHDPVFSADTLSFPMSPDRWTAALEYSISDVGVEHFSGPLAIQYGNVAPVQLSLRSRARDYRIDYRLFSADDVIFQNYDKAYSDEAGLDLFKALYVVWDINNYSAVAFCSANDPVPPNAPIPASALLLFTGLIGIIGFRRRMNNG